MTPLSAFYFVSGFRHDRCVALAQRWDDEAGYNSNVGEFWLMRAPPGPPQDNVVQAKLQLCYEALIPGAWLDASGACFLAGPYGTVHFCADVFADDAAQQWTSSGELDAALGGVWGLSPSQVWAWGLSGEEGKVYRFDGKTWKELPRPGFNVHAIHGPSENFLVAVGNDGGIALWDGSGWKQPSSPTEETLTSVHVVSPQEMYAVGFMGSVLQGSSYGWAKIGEGPRMPTGGGVPLLSVTQFEGELWVAAGFEGLLRRQGNTRVFECVKPNVQAVSFDGRESLMMAMAPGVVRTTDGQTFQAFGEDLLEQARQGKPLYEW